MTDDPADRDRTMTPIGGLPVRADRSDRADTPVNPRVVGADTGTHDLVELDAGDTDADSAHRMQRRVKETNIAAAKANSGIQTLRLETTAHVHRIDARFNSIDTTVGGLTTKVDTLADHVGKTAAGVARMEGQLGEIVKSVDSQRERQHVTFTAQVDVDREGKVADIKDTADVKLKRRELRYKIAMGVLGSASLISFLERIGAL